VPDLLSTRRGWGLACKLPHVRSRIPRQAGTWTAAPRPGPCAALVPSTTDSCHVPATSTENGPASTPPFPQTVAVPKPLACGFARATRAVRRPVKRALLPSGSRSIPQLSRLWPASPRNPSSHLTSLFRAPCCPSATPCLLLIGCPAKDSLGTNIMSPATFASPRRAHTSASNACQAANNHVRDSDAAWMRGCVAWVRAGVGHDASGGVSN
jgi:hypothetical protein